MKTKMVWVVWLITTAFAAMSQNQAMGRKEEIKAERKAFIERSVGLSGAEAEKFWKLDDELHSKLQEVRKSMRQELKAINEKGIDNVTDAELKRAMENRMNYEQKLLDLRKEYHTKYINLLGVKKTAKFYEAEREFKKNLLKKLRENSRNAKPSGEDED